MKKSYLIGLIILILIFENCQKQITSNDSITHFDIEVPNKTSVVKLSELGVKNVQYIPLKTDTDFLISEIRKLITTDSTFVIFTSNLELFQFEFNGNFINQIGTVGRGPQEYQFAFDFAIDNEKKQILIPIVNKSKLLIYSLNGKFIKSIPCPKYTKYIFYMDEGILCRCDYYGGKYSGENSMFLTDYEGDTIKL